MSISQTIATAVAEAALPTRCKACERHGLPILPLRRALVPDTRPAWTADDAQPAAIEGLRILRSGFLYVLLDESVWHAYQVTEQGHLRRIDPYEPPLGPPPPLPNKCVNADHDIPSAFINIDTSRYSTAWLAFSSDPWPASVLVGYKSAKFPSNRFQVLDLTQARENPDDVGLSITPDELQVDRQVFEYNQQLAGPFDSAHGFHSRFLRKTALRGFVINAMAKHELNQGVPAVVLHDTVGLIQEYNHQRLGWIVKRQAWREDPQRAYQLQTSQILQIIRATHRQWAAEKVPQFETHAGDGPPVFVDPQVEYQRIVEMRQRESDERLEERYDESRRAAFQLEYDSQEARFQWHIDQQAKNYATLCESTAFKLIEEYDYDGRDRDSGIAYSKTMAACLAGGITEAPRSAPEPGPPPAGSSEALWLKWLQDPNSPAYRAVILRDQAVLASLLPSFSQNGPVQWNDSDKLYAALSKLIASDDLGQRLRGDLRQAITEVQGALNAATQRLQAQITPGIQHTVLRLNTASQLLYNGVHLIELHVQMKLGEYYALQCAHLREVQKKASDAMAKARDRLRPTLDELKAGAHNGTRKVKPIIQTGLLSLAVLDPKIANTVINVSVWVEAKADVLREQLLREVNLNVNQLNNAAQLNLFHISVGVGTLELGARKILQGVQINAQQAAQLVRKNFLRLRGLSGSWDLLLALGGLYLLSNSLERNRISAEAVIGSKAGEAMIALYGTQVAILGTAAEIAGISISIATQARTLGRNIIRIGASISAAAGLIDTTQAAIAAKRTFREGDGRAAVGHALSAIAASLGTYYAIMAISTPLILGPLGIAISLSLIATSLSKFSSKEESTELESWARRSYFGYANETPAIHWNQPHHADLAFAELNAATLGVRTSITFSSNIVNASTGALQGKVEKIELKQKVKFRIRLPGFAEDLSSYQWSVLLQHHGDSEAYKLNTGKLAAYAEHFPLNRPPQTAHLSDLSSNPSPTMIHRHGKVKVLETRNPSSQEGNLSFTLELAGEVELTPDIEINSLSSASLHIIYWPDRMTPDGYAEILSTVYT
ncbi:hypothetical protein IAE37_000465 [Pseudomonas sp. S31]|uniref:T6SS effector BTH_I2691 family protein n=1 Tax=Pseudomonas sp. S31 TaxID=1564473 RepID=UPI001912BE4A|nr:T6SS effector BTH_I2691 family protein [Pseudomonas sp. S31]MBK4998189.1 hypothetical protein [Pseudomonas sp. S31]